MVYLVVCLKVLDFALLVLARGVTCEAFSCKGRMYENLTSLKSGIEKELIFLLYITVTNSSF